MKKGFTLILLLAFATLAMGVFTVGATAPSIRDLPRVVIGTTGTFNEAINVDEYVDWYGQFASDTQTINAGIDPYAPDEGFHVYIADPTGAALPVAALKKDGTERTALTATDITNMQVADLLLGNDVDPALPYSNLDTKNIYWGYTQSDPHWLSLKSLTMANGSSAAVAVVALVKSNVTTGTAKWLDISKTATANAVQYGKDFAAYGFTDFAGWTSDDTRGGEGYTGATVYTSGTKQVGWNASATSHSSSFFYGVWIGKDGDLANFIPARGGIGMAQPLFEARALMANETDRTSYEFCPAWRILALNAAQTHMAVVTQMGSSSSDISAANGPCAGNGYRFTGRLYWTPPFDLTQMGDGEQVSQWQAMNGTTVVANEGRDYAIQWDMIDLPGDRGIFTLRAMSIRTFDVAADLVASNPKVYDGGAMSQWDTRTGQLWDATHVFYPGACQGSQGVHHYGGAIDGAPLATAVRLWAQDPVLLGVTARLPRYQMCTVDNSTAANRRAIGFNKLVRLTLNMASGSSDPEIDAQDSAPIVRMFVSANSWRNGGSPILNNFNWFEFYGPIGSSYKVPNSRPRDINTGAFTLANPGAPKTGGSTVSLYLFTHRTLLTPAGLDPATEYEYIQPELAALSGGTHGDLTNPNSWPDETGYVDFTGLTIEDIDTVATLDPIYDSSTAGTQPLPFIANGSFELPALANGAYQYQNGVGFFPGWGTTGGCVAMASGSAFGNTAYDGRQNLGIQGGSSAVWQTIPMEVGATYILSWAEASRATPYGNNFLRITLNAWEIVPYHVVLQGSTVTWTPKSVQFVARNATDILNVQAEPAAPYLAGDHTVFVDGIN